MGGPAGRARCKVRLEREKSQAAEPSMKSSGTRDGPRRLGPTKTIQRGRLTRSVRGVPPECRGAG